MMKMMIKRQRKQKEEKKRNKLKTEKKKKTNKSHVHGLILCSDLSQRKMGMCPYLGGSAVER